MFLYNTNKDFAIFKKANSYFTYEYMREQCRLNPNFYDQNLLEQNVIKEILIRKVKYQRLNELMMENAMNLTFELWMSPYIPDICRQEIDYFSIFFSEEFIKSLCISNLYNRTIKMISVGLKQTPRSFIVRFNEFVANFLIYVYREESKLEEQNGSN